MEEDIKILERHVGYMKYEDYKYCTNKEEIKVIKAIENLLKGYRELKEENKQILNAKIGIDLSYDDYIPKSKIKEKIEELKVERQKIESSPYDKWDLYKVIGKIDILEEILREGE